ncbi:hypothetical protein PM082_021426 [Marasmius tenuissimus]|nr:hypothetical protein PM082_021426 [Marasmius tenuissimus]
MPSLWSYVGIDLFDWLFRDGYEEDGYQPFPTDEKVEMPRLIRVVQLFLGRSQSTPLDVFLRLAGHAPPEHLHLSMATAQLLDTLIPTAQRWKSLDINVLELAALADHHTVVRSLFAKLSSLQHLTLPWFWEGPALAGCPSVTSISCGDGVTPDNLLIPWYQIKSMHIRLDRRDSVQRMSHTLRSCPSVEDLCLEFVPITFMIVQPVVITSVRTLKVKAFNAPRNNPNRTSIFQFLNIPNLSALEVSGDELQLGAKAFSDFLARSSCVITHLTIQSSKLYKADEDAIVPFLQLLPSLKTLHLKEAPRVGQRSYCNEAVSGTLLRRLSAHQRSDSGSPFLPQLSELALSMYGHALDTAALIEAVQSRWLPNESDSDTGVTCLQSVIFEVRDGAISSLEPLEYLRDAGLRLEIFDHWTVGESRCMTVLPQ